MLYVILSIAGLGFGSFINVLAIRYNPNRRVYDRKIMNGRSRCDSCQKKLHWYELLPLVSFMIQLGRCRKCKKRIPLQHLIVEILTLAIWVGIPAFLNSFYNLSHDAFNAFHLPSWYYAITLLWAMVFTTWLLIALIDRDHYLIPDELNLFLIFLGIILVVLYAVYGTDFLPEFHNSSLKEYDLVFSPFSIPWLNDILGAAAGVLFYGALITISKGSGMGMGDVKLALGSGLILGWPDMALAIILSFIIGAFYGLVLIQRKKKTLKDLVPYAPLFVLGATITFFFGHAIVKAYFSVFYL